MIKRLQFDKTLLNILNIDLQFLVLWIYIYDITKTEYVHTL